MTTQEQRDIDIELWRMLEHREHSGIRFYYKHLMEIKGKMKNHYVDWMIFYGDLPFYGKVS
jgi:hypothetical protein